MNSPLYHPSRKVGDILWTVPLIAGPLLFALAVVAAWIDARGINWPFTRVITMFPFWLVSAGIVWKIIRASLCRNPAVSLAMGLAAGCFAVYCTWVWCAVFADVESPGGLLTLPARFGSLFVHPGALWERAQAIGAGIDWATGSQDHNASGLVGFACVAEAALVIGSCAFSQTFFFDRGQVYCERCDGWAKEWKRFRFGYVDDDALIRRVEDGDFDAALSYPPLDDPKAKQSVVMRVFVCSKCHLFATWEMSGTEETKLGDETIEIYCPPRGVMRVLAPADLEWLREAAPAMTAYLWLPG